MKYLIRNGQESQVTWHDPCHLANAQGVKQAPGIIKRIPGVEFEIVMPTPVAGLRTIVLRIMTCP